VTVTLSNESPVSLTLSKWNTPLDDATDVLRADMFRVTHSSGVEAVYTGIIPYRRPVLSDFFTFNPGQSTIVTLDLFKGYHFPSEGEYKIELATVIEIHEGDLEGDSIAESYAAMQTEFLGSNSIHVDVQSLKLAPVWGKPLQNNLTGPSPKSNCNSGQASQITTSGNNAISASLRGYNYLANKTCSTSVTSYITWFGACDTNRYNTVRNNLNTVNSFLKTTYPVDCAGAQCSANTYAYVFPTDTTRTIYVCAVFWKVTTANCVMDSQPGTIIHEASHFNNVASTGDYAYGIANCQNLAKSNPANAIRNADNYCFYTDSCP